MIASPYKMALGQELASPCMLVSARPYHPWYNVFLSQQTTDIVMHRSPPSLSVLFRNRQWCPCPLYKINCRPHTSITPTHELSQSYFSRFTLTSQDIHSLSTWFGHGSCIFQWYWYVVFSNILSIFIWSIYSCFFAFYIYIYSYSLHSIYI